MSIDSDFFFSLPESYTPKKFARSLENDLGLFVQQKNKHGVFTGNTLGMMLTFDPNHELEDDGECIFSVYDCRLGITGNVGAGMLRVIQLHQVINIALAMSIQYSVHGLIVHELSQRVIQLGYNPERDTIWNYDKGVAIDSYESLKSTLEFGVDYATN